MKFIIPVQAFSLALLLTFSFSCKKDDDGGGTSGPEETFASTCCETPHLEGCIGGANIFVPNAFTPNADGINDVLFVFIGKGIKKINHFIVSDSEGLTVHEVFDFQINNLDLGWDGRLPDGTMAEAIFSYSVSATNVADEMEEFEGYVCCRFSFPVSCVDHEKHCVFGTQHDGNGGFDPFLPTFEECQ